jgi:P2 family phage major capsid protein
MNRQTRTKFNALIKKQCDFYKVDTMAATFDIDPVKSQRLIGKIQHSSEFLQMVNMPIVVNQTGESLRIGVDEFTASRTDTSGNTRRQPKSHHSGTANAYFCNQVNFDTALTYKQLDAWAHQPNFNALVQQKLTRAHALSLISMGFNGHSVAADSDIVAYPMLQDCSKGWLQKLREGNADNYLDSENITLSDDNTLDLVVNQARNAMSSPERLRPDLVVVVGHELLAYNKDRLYAKQGLTPTEKTNIELRQVIDTFGGLPAYDIPYFPRRGILITPFSNLSIYMQRGTMRRSVKDEDHYDRVADYMSNNLDYVVEDLDSMIYISSHRMWLDGETPTAVPDPAETEHYHATV